MVKPLIGLDMDGVICQPPLGLNLGIGRGPYLGTGQRPRLPRGWLPVYLRRCLLSLRYAGRGPMADAREGLCSIQAHRSLVLVTSRDSLGRHLVLSWLRRHRLIDAFEAIYTNDTGLPSPEFKGRTASELGIREFVDDDGRVADYLARRGLEHIYLRDWPRNRGYKYSENVTRFLRLAEVGEALARTQGPE